jgi:hypothetical protein
MFKVGDHVVFLLDGAKGIIISIATDRLLCHVLWEDRFCSWERVDLLIMDELLDHTDDSSNKIVQ